MKTQSISHLLYYPITFYARSSPSDSYLSFPRSVLSILSLLVAWNHRYADNHKWRAGRNRERTRREGRREGYRGVTRRDLRGVRETAWFVVRMILRYVTGNLVQFTITYYVTTTMRPTTNRTGKRGWPIERIRGWLQTLIRTFPWTLQLRFRWNITRMHILLLRLFKLWPEAIPKQEFVSSFFALQGSSPSKRVPLWSALHSVPSTPSIIFWSRICSILERTGARCLEPTSRTWLETLVSLRLYEASKVGRARKRERENARTCGSWILGPMKTTMRKALCCGNSAAETKKRIGEHRFRRRNFPSQPSVRASSHSLWIPEFRARVVGTQPWAALSGHPRIYRIHHDEFRGIRCLDGFYSVVPSWKRIRS